MTRTAFNWTNCRPSCALFTTEMDWLRKRRFQRCQTGLMPLGLRVSEPKDIHQFELRRWKLTDSGQREAFPLRIPSFEAPEKLSIVGIERGMNRLHKAIERFDMILIGEWLEGHSFELSLERSALILSARADQLSDRAPVAYQRSDEAVTNLVDQPFCVQQALHVEQIARMLPVQRGTNLSAEKLTVREASRLDERLKPLLHLVRTWQVAEGKEMAAQGGINLHLDLGLAALAVELDLHPFLALACLGHAGRWQAAFDVRLDPGESLTDRAQGLGPVVDR